MSTGFKINDGTWSSPEYNIGSGGGNLTIGRPYYYRAGSDGNIMIDNVAVVKKPHLILDMNKGTILLEGEKDADADERYYFVGTFNDWLIDSPESLMTKEGDSYVRRGVTLPNEPGDGRFKIAAPFWANSWGYGYDSDTECITPEKTIAILSSEANGTNSDMRYTISGIYDVWWNPATSRVSFVKTGDIPDDPFAYDYGDLYIIGDNVNGNHWLLGDESAKFVSVGKGRYEWAGTYLGNGFKINDGTWNSTVLNGLTLNIGSNGEGLVLDQPYNFYTGGSSENIGFATVSEVFNPIVSLDMNARTIIVSADGHALTLLLPDEAADGRYKNCVIELVDASTGIKQRYIITDRLSYTFQGVGSKNEYTLRMFTPSNVEIAMLEGIKMPKDDMEVSFTDIRDLYPVGIEILAPGGEAIADGVTVEWFARNSEGEYSYLRQGMEAGRWPSGATLLCKVALGEKLSTLYSNPSDTTITVNGEGDLVKLSLAPLSRIRLTGQVVDDSGAPVDGVTVAVGQLLNGKYPYSNVGRTDRSGNWMAEALEGAQPEIVFSAKDYVTQRKTLGFLTGDSEEISVGRTVMPTITGAKLTLAVSYRAAGSDDISSFFTDYQNLALEVFNVTQGRLHNNISVQYPVLAVLDEEIQPGDELKLTLRSLTGLFAPVERTVKLDSDLKGNVEAAIVGKGGIKAGFSMTDNPEVSASLYDASGELVGKKTYSEASVEFTGLEAGKYTLLSMGRSDMMDAPLRLSLLSEIGLKEGKDYVINQAEVTDGELTLISNSEIPPFDDSPYYFTTDNSGVSANKSSITTGNYLTLRADVDFRGAYADKIENVSLIFDFPQGSDFVNQSVISGSAPIPYTLEGTRLIIPLGNEWRKQVRFCVIPTVAGRYTATANLRFDYEGEEKMQPLGYASSNVKEMEITVPKVIQTPKFNVTGVTLANSQVSVYDDGALIATGKADSNGAWKVECELPQAYNLSVHPIQAEVITPEGNTLMSEKQNVTYDMNAIRVSKVTMYHWNPELSRTCVSEFDFLNPKTTGSQWDLYYPEKKFTYTIEFTENNPEKISNVILYVHTADGQFVPVAASYDSEKGCWYATIDMGSEANAYYPVNCSIDFEYIADKKIDVSETGEVISMVKALMSEYENAQRELKEYFYSNSEVDESSLNQLLQSFGIEVTLNSEERIQLPQGFDSWDDVRKEAFLDEEYDRMSKEVDSILPSLDYLETAFTFSREMEYEHDGVKFKMSSCRDFKISDPVADGYQEMETTNGIKVYIKIEEESIVCVDYDNDLLVEVIFTDNNPFKVKRNITFRDAMEAYSQCMSSIGNVLEIINARWAELTSLAQMPLDKIEDAITEMTARLQMATNYKNLSTKNVNKRMKWAMEEARLTNSLASLKMAKKICGPLVKNVLKALPFASYVAILWDCYDKSDRIYSIFKSIPDPCPDAQSEADLCKNLCLGLWGSVAAKATVDVIGNFSSDAAIIGGIFGSLATAGTSLGATVIGTIGKTLMTIGGILVDSGIDWGITSLGNKVGALKCKKDKKCGDEGMPPCPPIPNPNPNSGGGAHPSGSSPDNPKQDPSGYVYEAVPENRVEGVQASIYYKETKEDMYGQPYEEVMLWNAEEYAQRNPLFTDERGMYRWDVPQGLWQVKFEKDGYVTAYSEWLPVPPPQLDVNIGITQHKQPEVVEARAYEEGVEVRFDKYMKPLTLTTENIHVSVGGETLPGRIELLDEGLAEESEEDGVKFASRVRFIPEEPLSLTTGEIRLTVSPNVLSYAGIAMGEVYTQILDVEKEVQIISAEDTRVLYGEEKEITVFALPSEAAAGRRLNVSTASDIILTVADGEMLFDEEGKARIMVKAGLPGETRLFFSIPDVTVTGDCKVDVVTEIIEAEAPKSSRASGTEVYRGTKVELSTPTKDAIIYYTLDGSCPCDADGTRRKYTVPIVINDDTQILAMAMVGNHAEDVSDVVAFNYTLKRNAMEYAFPKGWSWISHSFESALPADLLLEDPSISHIVSSQGEYASTGDEDYSLTAAQSYKVEASANAALPRMTDVAWNPATPIALHSGINWIGYPMSQTMSLDEAFSAMEPEISDVVIGQSGFAEFDGERWVGTLETMVPGAGYLYKSKSDKELIYNRSIVSKARAQKARRAADRGDMVDIHKYPDVMPIVAAITDKGERLDADRYEVTAYVGDECRGIGRLVDGRIMMTVHGRPNDNIAIVVTDMNYFSQSEVDILPFEEDVLGSLDVPYEFDLSNQTNGISELDGGSGISVDIIDRDIVIGGVDPADIELVKVIDMEGKVVISMIRPETARIKLPSLQEGLYVVVVGADGKISYRKVMLK
ncbi:MAG: chitobiase/beta-hexosaminidase C-terminal domain-containing protein [Muribaculaceae bacterium]|nr:chitobiase/beta-hexosaminidase C-terminal domain-containing protein [Muribaculaceae bacterium]